MILEVFSKVRLADCYEIAGRHSTPKALVDSQSMDMWRVIRRNANTRSKFGHFQLTSCILNLATELSGRIVVLLHVPSEIIERETVMMCMAHQNLGLRQKFKVGRKLAYRHVLDEFEHQWNDGRLKRCSVFNRGPMKINMMMTWSEVWSCLGCARIFLAGVNQGQPRCNLT